MNVVCINGSPRSNGSSAFLIDKVLEGMGSKNVRSKIYCLGDMKINYCAGCKKCYLTGHCFQKDDMDIIIDDIIKSNLIIMASPSYWGDVTGQLKVFLIGTLHIAIQTQMLIGSRYRAGKKEYQ